MCSGVRVGAIQKALRIATVPFIAFPSIRSLKPIRESLGLEGTRQRMLDKQLFGRFPLSRAGYALNARALVVEDATQRDATRRAATVRTRPNSQIGRTIRYVHTRNNDLHVRGGEEETNERSRTFWTFSGCAVFAATATATRIGDAFAR